MSDTTSIPWGCVLDGDTIRVMTLLEKCAGGTEYIALEAAVPELVALVSSEYQALLETGIEYPADSGTYYRLTDEVRGLAQGIRVNIMLGLVTAGPVVLVTRDDGTGIFATVEDYQTFYLAALARFQEISTKAGTAKASIRAASTVAEALAAYTGWSA